MARKLVTLLVIASFATLVFAFAGCGGDDESASGDTTTTETTTTEETTDTETTDTETTDTETTDTETTDTTETSDVPDFATSKNCREFQQIGAKISEAFSGTGETNLDEASDAFAELTAAAPEEIKDDLQVIEEAYNALADALQGVDLSSPNPDPATIQKLTEVSQQFDQAELTQASQNIAAWAQENC